MSISTLYFVIGFTWLTALIIDKFLKWRTRRALTIARNYKSSPRETPWDILGINKVVSAAQHIINATSLSNTNRLFARYGHTYSSKILTQRVFFTCHPENIRHILITGFADFDNSKGIRDHLFAPITPTGIFALDGTQWKAARGLYRDIFSHTRQILDLQVQEECFKNLQAKIPVGQAVDLQPLFLRLTMDLTTAFAVGETLDCLRDDQAAAKKEFMHALMYVKKIMARDGFLGPLHHFLGKKRFHASCRIVHEFIEDLIRKRLAQKWAGVRSDSHTPCLLDTLVESSESVVDIRDGVVTILIAGIDSVASLLSTTFFVLSRNKRVLSKLRQQVLDVTQNEPPTYDMLRAMPYLRYVFNETMRVYPPVPFNARTANTNTFLPTGAGPDGKSPLLVEKGERVIFSSWGSHRSPEYFGEDAHDFHPERWETLKAEALGYIPFNLGPRACPGQHFALSEASYVTARLLQTFENITSRDSREWVENLGLNLSNRNGTMVELA